MLARVQANPRQAGADGMLIPAASRCSWTAAAARARLGCIRTEQGPDGIDTGNRGYPQPTGRLVRSWTELSQRGVHVSTHAIGDRAIDWVVDTYDQCSARRRRATAHGIIHANTPSDRGSRPWPGCSAIRRGYPSVREFHVVIGDNYLPILVRSATCG